MTRISSPLTAVFKWALPVGWFVVLALLAGAAAGEGAASSSALRWLSPLAAGLLGFGLMRHLVRDLADRVDDAGTFLVARRGNVESQIRLTDIETVAASHFSSPRRITLHLEQPCELGERVAFAPAGGFTINPLARNTIAKNLLARVLAAKAAARAF